MKKNRFLWALLLLVSLGAAAQDNIHFVAGTPTQKGLSQKNNLFSERRRRRKDYCGT